MLEDPVHSDGFFISSRYDLYHDKCYPGQMSWQTCPGVAELIRLNKKVSEEVRTILYHQKFCFRWPSTYQAFAKIIGPKNLAFIKDITIFHLGPEDDEEPDWDETNLIDDCSRCLADLDSDWAETRDFSGAVLLPEMETLDSLTINQLTIPSYDQFMQLPERTRDILMAVAKNLRIHGVASVAEVQHVFSMLAKAPQVYTIEFLDPVLPQMQWHGFVGFQQWNAWPNAFLMITHVQRGQIIFKFAHAWLRHMVNQQQSDSILNTYAFSWSIFDPTNVNRWPKFNWMGFHYFPTTTERRLANDPDRAVLREIKRLLDLGGKYDAADEGTWV